ncbi:MAG: hypothetical protein GF308_17930 [Candidatus Heimdallarchaeota archaeon]|nr:hypothetical protein [Candidatus Heimdallarchaeota archaeon]
MTKKPDLRSISSIMLSGDADFDEVRVLGGLDSKGSLNANFVDVHGSINMDGSLWANNISVKGGIKLKADLIAEEDIEIAGGVEIRGKIKGRNIEVMGGIEVGDGIIGQNLEAHGGITSRRKGVKIEEMLKVIGGLDSFGPIQAREIFSMGGLSTEESIQVEKKIEVHGKIEVKKDIECDEFFFKITSPSVVYGKIQANKIRIELDENATNEAFLRVKEIVSPNKIEIDYVIAEQIICPKIKSGENCRIGVPLDQDYEPLEF